MSPEARKRLSPVIRKFMKSPHPFRACVRALTGKPGITNPEGVCGVLKSLGKRGAALSEDGLEAEAEKVITEMEDAGLTEELVPVLEMYLVMEAAELEAATLSEGDASAGPLIEAAAQVIVPQKGKLFAEDGTCKIAVIRPCISNGRRLRGLPPIYTPKMLAEHAGVFSDWHMFMDHLSEEMVEAMRRRNRSIRELGGRITKSWWDPDLETKEDDSRGFKKGGVVARALPQPAVRAMLEADPEILRVSINAWPTAAREGEMWGQKGMLIEGIRSTPRGSVDWVLRDGAGGRPLAEDEQLAVSLVERYYDARPGDDVSLPKPITEMTAAELAEHLKTTAPDTYKLLEDAGTLKAPSSPAAPASTAPASTPPAAAAAATTPAVLTEERVREMLKEKDSEVAKEAEKLAKALLAEQETHRSRSEKALRMIEGAKGITKIQRDELRARYVLLPSGPGPALLAEDEKDGDTVKRTADQVFEDRVKADLQTAVNVVLAAQGKPVVEAQGGQPKTEAAGTVQEDGTGKQTQTGKTKTRQSTAFRDFMLEGGGFEKPEDVDKLFEEVHG